MLPAAWCRLASRLPEPESLVAEVNDTGTGKNSLAGLYIFL
jgi:hypothetical protein